LSERFSKYLQTKSLDLEGEWFDEKFGDFQSNLTDPMISEFKKDLSRALKKNEKLTLAHSFARNMIRLKHKPSSSFIQSMSFDVLNTIAYDSTMDTEGEEDVIKKLNEKTSGDLMTDLDKSPYGKVKAKKGITALPTVKEANDLLDERYRGD
jgi:hypothetical protein